VTSYAALLRAELVAALRAVPAQAPTLCAGWTAQDLAAHLVAREHRPDSCPGLIIPAFAGWTERVRAGYARRPYSELVDLVASGPPWTSPFALPGTDAALNFTEHLVHTEDVRRAQPGWRPRDLTPDLREAIWRVVRSRGRMLLARAPVTIVPTRSDSPDGPPADRAPVGRGPEVVIAGGPLELLLFAFGRRDHALVEFSGPDHAVAAARSMTPRP
jgi:uncharacterized protein (TIGR03085 family)